jgi:large exoprotein involved in heme utilization and adhesion
MRIADLNFPAAQGNAGRVYIKGLSVSITDGALVEANSNNSGGSGNIDIVAKDFVELSGTGPFPSFFPDKTYDTYRLSNRIYSSLTTSSEQDALGPGGTISITTNKLRLSDGANIRADSKSSFRGGDIIINARSIELTGGGQIFTSSSGTGSAGNITLNVTNRIAISGNNPGFDNARQQVIQDELNFGRRSDQNRSDAESISEALREIGTISPNSGIFANSSGSGKAGNIQATASLIQLDQATISSNTRGGEGNISLHSNNLLLDRGSSITTNASGNNVTGGNIKIDTDALAAVQGSRISANSTDFRGGQITINLAPLGGIFLSSDSKITATGANSQSNGTVKISTPDTDPSRALTILPTVTEETPKLVSSSCAAFNEAAGGNNFIITGRGGLPPSPGDPLNSDVVWTDTRLPVTVTQQHQFKKDSAQKSSQPKPIAIVPATGWVLNSKGEIMLISSASNANLRTPISCPSQ